MLVNRKYTISLSEDAKDRMIVIARHVGNGCSDAEYIESIEGLLLEAFTLGQLEPRATKVKTFEPECVKMELSNHPG